MSLVKWEPRRGELSTFRTLREEIDRVFEDFFRGWPRPFVSAWPAGAGTAALPSVNLRETENEFVLTAEIPGVTKDEIRVTIAEDEVTLKAERKAEEEAKEEDFYYRELSRRSFERVVPLPARVQADQAVAKLKDGVLTLTLPKAMPSKKSRVAVKVE